MVRVSVVNFFGNIVLDTLVKPYAGLDYDALSKQTGIRLADFDLAPSYPKIASLVSDTPIQPNEEFRCGKSWLARQ